MPRAWSDGYAALRAMPTPEGFWPDRWRHLVDDAGRFLDNWAGEASRCEWDVLDVFRVHPEAPTARFDCMGLIMLLGGVEIVGVDEGGADLAVKATGSQQRFYRRPLPPGTIPLWELGCAASTRFSRDLRTSQEEDHSNLSKICPALSRGHAG